MIPIIALLHVAAVDFFLFLFCFVIVAVVWFGFILAVLVCCLLFCFLCDLTPVPADVTMTRGAVVRRRREGDTGLVPAGCSV